MVAIPWELSLRRCYRSTVQSISLYTGHWEGLWLIIPSQVSLGKSKAYRRWLRSAVLRLVFQSAVVVLIPRAQDWFPSCSSQGPNLVPSSFTMISHLLYLLCTILLLHGQLLVHVCSHALVLHLFYTASSNLILLFPTY